MLLESVGDTSATCEHARADGVYLHEGIDVLPGLFLLRREQAYFSRFVEEWCHTGIRLIHMRIETRFCLHSYRMILDKFFDEFPGIFLLFRREPDCLELFPVVVHGVTHRGGENGVP